MTTATSAAFNPAQYKKSTFDQWQSAAAAWYRWSPLLRQWLGAATDIMLDMAGVSAGHHVLDIAAGAGEQSITAARKVGPSGRVLATDISPNILDFARKMANDEGLDNVHTEVMDGENLTVRDESFDAVISRVGLIYFPDQQKALREMWRALRPGGSVAAIVYSTAENNKFFSIPVTIIRRRAQLPPPVPGQPGPFSLGKEGVIEAAFRQAGFVNITAVRVPSPVRLPAAKDCIRFEQESFGALHQMMSGLTEKEKEETWQEIEQELKQFESDSGFVGPCEMIVAVGQKPLTKDLFNK